MVYLGALLLALLGILLLIQCLGGLKSFVLLRRCDREYYRRKISQSIVAAVIFFALACLCFAQASLLVHRLLTS